MSPSDAFASLTIVGKLGRARDAVERDAVLAEAADHVEVDDPDDRALEVHGRMVDPVRRSEQAVLLAGPGDDEHRAPRRRGGKPPRDLEDAGGARRVVVGAVVDLRPRPGRGCSAPPKPEVVVVRAEDHDLVRLLAAADDPEHVVGLAAEHVDGASSARRSTPRSKPRGRAALRRSLERLERGAGLGERLREGLA